jgi:hypothetical protein
VLAAGIAAGKHHAHWLYLLLGSSQNAPPLFGTLRKSVIGANFVSAANKPNKTVDDLPSVKAVVARSIQTA